MKIELGKFTIISDTNQFILYCKTVRKAGKNTGQTGQDICGYYSDMTACLVELHRHICLTSKATTLQELIQEINDYKTIVLNNIDPNTFPELYRRKKKVSEL